MLAWSGNIRCYFTRVKPAARLKLLTTCQILDLWSDQTLVSVQCYMTGQLFTSYLPYHGSFWFWANWARQSLKWSVWHTSCDLVIWIDFQQLFYKLSAFICWWTEYMTRKWEIIYTLLTIACQKCLIWFQSLWSMWSICAHFLSN